MEGMKARGAAGGDSLDAERRATKRGCERTRGLLWRAVIITLERFNFYCSIRRRDRSLREGVGFPPPAAGSHHPEREQAPALQITPRAKVAIPLVELL